MKKILSILESLYIFLILASFMLQLFGIAIANPTIPLAPDASPQLSVLPPIISILSPRNNTLYNSRFITFAFNVTIPNSNISSDTPTWWTYYTTDWEQGTILVHQQNYAGDEQCFKEFSINLTSIPEGSHSIELYARILIDRGHYAHDETSKALVNFAIDSTPPRISGVSIENKTYSSTELLLTFTVDEQISQASYSLDNQANVTINGNTTMQGLTEGTHNLIVYATDAAGNTGVSEMIAFSVATPVSTTVVAAAAVFTVVVVASLLVYFRKGAHRLGRESSKSKLP